MSKEKPTAPFLEQPQQKAARDVSELASSDSICQFTWDAGRLQLPVTLPPWFPSLFQYGALKEITRSGLRRDSYIGLYDTFSFPKRAGPVDSPFEIPSKNFTFSELGGTFETVWLTGAQTGEVMRLSFRKARAEPQGREGPTLLSWERIYLLDGFELQTELERKWGEDSKVVIESGNGDLAESTDK